MKQSMKHAHNAALAAMATICAGTGCFAQDDDLPSYYTPEYRRMLRNGGALAKVTLAVSDEDSNPVSNATVKAWFNNYVVDDGYGVSGTTDEHGRASIEGKSVGQLRMHALKDGYYASHVADMLIISHDPARLQDGRWLPWNTEVPVVMRKVKNPIPMYAKQFIGGFANGATVGFDCVKGDFVAPHGIGETADFNITVTGRGIAPSPRMKTASLDAIDPGGGFMVLKKHPQSVFKSEYFAPEHGYATNLSATSHYINRMYDDGPDNQKLYDGDDDRVGSDWQEYLVFKSRIKRDKDGNIISANYGKVYSEFMFGASEQEGRASVRFTYHFNPTPNDRNLEYDFRKNLSVRKRGDLSFPDVP